MCGIAGFVAPQGYLDAAALNRIAAKMTSTLRHRGPDDSGTWSDPDAGVALGHQRLAILDLSAAGRQPMVSASGRYVIVYNGEIYNHQEIRQALEIPRTRFRGHSDTETLLASMERWGIEKSLQHANGMFAFALWDNERRRLTLARDRLGIKPLYYGWMNGVFLFASELKALRGHPSFRGDVDRGALALYLQHNYVPAPWSIYQGIYKLPPGTTLTVSLSGEPSRANPVVYWSMKEQAERGQAEPFRGTPEQAVDALAGLLAEAVDLRTLSDVPLGAFLSGGVDSSTIVALMQAKRSQAVKTFSIGFHEAEYDEAPAAGAIADHLGTEHVECYVTPKEALEVVPRLPQLYDEPFADSSQIPTFLVSQLAREHVTVSLSGDGGDEWFGGYERYRRMQSLWRRFGRVPSGLRTAGARLLRWCLPGRGGGTICRKLRTLSELLDVPDARGLYTRFHTHWKDPLAVVIDGRLPATAFYRCGDWARRDDFLEEMMYVDSITYLPDDILVKVDRASMSVGLEARMPFLDHRLVEFAWTLPANLKVRDGRTKWIVRQILGRHVPRQLVEGPKSGFGVPIDRWLRGPLRDWAEDLLSEERLNSDGFFHAPPIRRLWQEHLNRSQDWHYYLWDILMFQAWWQSVREETTTKQTK
ncbi:MAG: asparagine synthase (glutamine-hydrolyzing) [Pirellulaceae bacterium]